MYAIRDVETKKYHRVQNVYERMVVEVFPKKEDAEFEMGQSIFLQDDYEVVPVTITDRSE